MRLAPDYVALLCVQDGGAVSEELNAFPLDPPDPWAATRVWLPELYAAPPAVSAAKRRRRWPFGRRT